MIAGGPIEVNARVDGNQAVRRHWNRAKCLGSRRPRDVATDSVRGQRHRINRPMLRDRLPDSGSQRPFVTVPEPIPSGHRPDLLPML